MALENLKQNVERMKEIAREMEAFSIYSEDSMSMEALNSLKNQLKIINNSIPLLVENISLAKKLGGASKASGLVAIKDKGKQVTISEKYKQKFLKELSLSIFPVKKARAEKARSSFKKPSAYARLSNRFFMKTSNNLLENKKFLGLNESLRKANLLFLVNTYISIILFTTLLSIFFALILFAFLMFFSVGIDFPFIFPAELNARRLMINALISIAIPFIVFFALYFYPFTEKQNIKKKIDQELPFATMHMSAIAGSGIEPSQIFKIIVLEKEYPNTMQEIKKVLNQVNVYGYDLVSALKNTAKSTSSNKLAELFNGLATTISSGGSLGDFLDKRTETLLFDYRLEREKNTKTAETFMDIYISTVIAAPMIMMLLLVLMSVSQIGIGLGLNALTFIIISIVSLVNIIFLVILHLKQPKY